jgi:aldehyde:ferredoxin oxidoreductase
MWFGWAGFDLEIDLSKGKVEKKERDPEFCKMYLGSRGVGSKILWDRVPAEADPFSEQNLLILGAGPLVGTLAPGANRTVLTTRSPQTSLETYSSMGGFWAPELKQAGYDNIVIAGRSPDPVYIYIKDEIVEIREAANLWGMDTRKTQQMIREELKNDKVQTLCIGPAGEKKVHAATIEHGQGASLSRTGIGAVLGDKNLKGIALYGTKDTNIAKPTEFLNLCEKILKKSDILRRNVDNWSYDRAPGLLSAQYSPRKSPCCNCTLGCVKSIRLPDGEICYMKCQSYLTLMAASKIQDFTFAMRAFNMCQKYGLDHISTANYVGFAIDCYQKGLITKHETEGMELEWGNPEVTFSLIRKIAYREGIGDVLANGLYEAAQMLLGPGGEQHVYHVKKHEMLTANPRRPYHAFASAIADKPDYSRVESGLPNYWLETKTKEVRKKYAESEFFPYPEELKEPFLDDFDYAGNDYERITKMTSFDVDKNAIADCTGICIYWLGFWAYQPIQLQDHIDLISLATGVDYDETTVLQAGRRAGMLIRAYNAMMGMRKKDDTIPEIYFTKEPPAPFIKLDHDRFDKMIYEYYKLRGLNREGIPTKETLRQLGLESVAQELERRNIL